MLIIFYIVLISVISDFATMTALWWKKPDSSEAVNNGFDEWRIIYAKVCPVSIFGLFMFFNIWIQCSNRSISREIIHPWVSCRCSLYTFLFLLPILITTVEIVGICQYVYLLNTGYIYVGYFYMMGFSLLPASWF